jgi:hypothetical protein
MGNLCCAKEHSVQFFCSVFYTVKLHSLTVQFNLECMGALTRQSGARGRARFWHLMMWIFMCWLVVLHLNTKMDYSVSQINYDVQHKKKKNETVPVTLSI